MAPQAASRRCPRVARTRSYPPVGALFEVDERVCIDIAPLVEDAADCYGRVIVAVVDDVLARERDTVFVFERCALEAQRLAASGKQADVFDCGANRADGFYYARIVNQIPFEQILRGRPNRTFTVNFRCKPFLYLHDSSPFTLTDSIGIIANPGTVYSEPIITVNGTGDVTIMINGEILELTDLSGSITMDSELREAYSGNESANSHMDGEFIRLLAGNNAYSWDGDVTSIQITPNWRTL